MSRLPRLLLSSWVNHKGPQQRPQFTYGHGLKMHLSNAGVDVKHWGSLAIAISGMLLHKRRMFKSTPTEVATLGWMYQSLSILLLIAFCLCSPRMLESGFSFQLQVHPNLAEQQSTSNVIIQTAN
jgi:hypothetical protein